MKGREITPAELEHLMLLHRRGVQREAIADRTGLSYVAVRKAIRQKLLEEELAKGQPRE